MRLLVATRNAGKVREVRDALAGIEVELVDLAAWPAVESPPETGATFQENALLKAAYYHRATGLPAVADDSGLEVDALGGAPGLHSARFLGADSSHREKIEKVLEALAGVPRERRTARFYCALAVAAETGVRFQVVETCEGLIEEEARGKEGFGYDPIFFFPPLGKTFGELSTQEKRFVSARGKALGRLRSHLAEPDTS